jgi:uncharacterized protein (TIGR02270 family)
VGWLCSVCAASRRPGCARAGAGTHGRALAHTDARLRTRAVRAAGELGRVDLLGGCLFHLDDDVPAAVVAARSAVLLGDRGKALRFLRDPGSDTAPARRTDLGGFRLRPAGRARLIKGPAANGADAHSMIRAGLSGDVQLIPWLFTQMRIPAYARLAGEASGFIAGVDRAWHRLHQDTPYDCKRRGPKDDPTEDNVALDGDEDLRWPDVNKVSTWWNENRGRFNPGSRYFVGELPAPAHCIEVLRKNTQRQRIAAALQLRMLLPGKVMFNCVAPANRQARLLAHMITT